MPSHPFVCETLVSGGPRHTTEAELGEDMAGTMTFPWGTLFYIADATSDEGHIGPFSSRYLASSLGYWFMKNAMPAMASAGENMAKKPAVGELFRKSLDDLQAAWKKESANFWKKDGAEEEFNKWSEVYKTKDSSGRLKSFSTTFCCGIISAIDRSVALVRTGDIDLHMKIAGEEVSSKPVRKERIFAQLIKKDGGKTILRLPEVTYENYSAENIDFMLVKTDGVKFINEELSLNRLAGGQVESILNFRKILLKGTKAATGDDKALLYCCFLNQASSEK